MCLFSFFPAVARRFFSKPMQKLPLIFSLSPSSLTTTAHRQNIPPPPPSSQASPILNGTFAPPIGNDRIRQQEQEKKQALAGALDDVVSGSLSAADGASDAARQALGSLEAKVSASFVAAALPPAAKAGATETAAAAAALKNATVNAARDKAVLAAKTKRAFRDAAGAALDRAWGRAAGLESDVSEPLQLSKATLVGGGGGGSSSSSSSSSDADYVGAGPPPRKTRAAVAAGRAATAATLETAGKLFDAAFLKGRKEQFGVLVAIDVRFDPPKGINGVGPGAVSPQQQQQQDFLASALAKKVSQLKAATAPWWGRNASSSFAASSGVDSASSYLVGLPASPSQPQSSSSSLGSLQPPPPPPSAEETPVPPSFFVTPATVDVPAAAPDAGEGKAVFSSEVVRGVPGDTLLSPSLVDPSSVAAAVRETLLSKLHRDASSGDVDAATLLAGVGGGGGGVRGGGDSSVRGRRAPLITVRGASVDAQRGVYLVRVSMPALLLPSPPLLPRPSASLRARLMNAVNDVAPGDAAASCVSLRERTGFDACGAIDAGTHLTVSGVRLLAADVGGEEDALGGGASVPLLAPLATAATTLAAEAAGALQTSRRSQSEDSGGSGGVVGFARVDMGGREFGGFLSSIFESIPKLISVAKDTEMTGLVRYLAFFGPLSTALVSAGCLSTLIASLFGGDSGINQSAKYLSEINATTHEILLNVKELKKTLSLVQEQLTGIEKQIASLDCSEAIRGTDALIDVVRNRWREYTESTLFGPRFALEAALEDQASGRRAAVDPSSIFSPWVARVLGDPGAGAGGGAGGEQSLYNALMNLHDRLARPDIPASQKIGVIDVCGAAAEAAFRHKFQVSNGSASRVFSFDDRQLFLPLHDVLAYYQVWQARGSQMLQEALTFRAQESAVSAWAANQPVPGCADRSPATPAAASRVGCVLDADQLPTDLATLCVRLAGGATALPPNFATARAWCDRLSLWASQISENVQAQLEIAGVPYSWGEAGAGVRTVHGSDVTGRNATLGAASASTVTRWLLPASPQAFAAECLDPEDASCPLLGLWNETSFSASLAASNGLTLGYPTKLWKPATAEAWQAGLRGMQPLPAGAEGDAASMLSLMENGFEAKGAVPFRNISDRNWVSPFISFRFSLWHVRACLVAISFCLFLCSSTRSRDLNDQQQR